MAAPHHLAVYTWRTQVAGEWGATQRLAATVGSVEAGAATQLFLWCWGVRRALHLYGMVVPGWRVGG